MRRTKVLLVALAMFAIVNTAFLFAHIAYAPSPTSSQAPPSSIGSSLSSLSSSVSPNPPTTPGQAALQFFLNTSPALSTSSWILVGGVWIWRGRTKSRWESLGFDSQTFDLFMKMKGAKTRLTVLDALSKPKDRLQLAQELGLDWKAIDYHIVILNKYGLVHEEQASGRVKMYELTPLGTMLLGLLKDLNKEIERGPELSPSTLAPDELR